MNKQPVQRWNKAAWAVRGGWREGEGERAREKNKKTCTEYHTQIAAAVPISDCSSTNSKTKQLQCLMSSLVNEGQIFECWHQHTVGCLVVHAADPMTHNGVFGCPCRWSDDTLVPHLGSDVSMQLCSLVCNMKSVCELTPGCEPQALLLTTDYWIKLIYCLPVAGCVQNVCPMARELATWLDSRVGICWSGWPLLLSPVHTSISRTMTDYSCSSSNIEQSYHTRMHAVMWPHILGHWLIVYIEAGDIGSN